ncbi:uncharacterized protein [Miscanthus floridulus]|uniref:uncharacterized protein n=1 Tax=Miscanthus floridulus TaxID=154761 RepID=UPI00345A84BD
MAPIKATGLSSVLCNPSSSASLHPCRDHTSPPGPNAEESCNPTIGEDNTCVFKLQILDDVPLLKFPGTRLTKKPFKFCSPFKYGIMSRPPPFLELSLWMHSFLCADDSPLKRKTLMHFGTQSLTGQDIALSFADGKFIDFVFMDGFIKCITEDDLIVRPYCHGYRIFLEPLISDIIKSESINTDNSQPPRSQAAVVESIKRCLPTTDLKKANMIFLPVLHLRHWSVYCINLGQARVDVLDTNNYSCNTESTWDTHHSPMGRLLMQRLSVALSKAAPRKFPRFENWRHVPIRVPFEKNINDSGLFSMKFIEFYDGEGHGSLHTTIHADRSTELRAEMLQYMAFHTANNVHPPNELLQFRLGEFHPAYHPMFY